MTQENRDRPNNDLSGEDLHGEDLSGALLEGFDLSGCNLQNANLRGAFLYRADLFGADLRGADLTAARLIGSRLMDANLEGAILCEVEAEAAVVADAKLSGSNWTKAELSLANFAGADLSRCDFTGACLVRANLTSAKLDATNFHHASLHEAILCDVDLSQAARLGYATSGECRVDLLCLQRTSDGLLHRPSQRQSVEAFLRESIPEELLDQCLAILARHPSTPPQAPAETDLEVDRRFREKDPLAQFRVQHIPITPARVEALERCLDGATKEQEVQSFLEANPDILVRHIGGGHGLWVIPRAELGKEHVTDFMIAERNSLGMCWTAVELENPRQRLFTKAGDPTAILNHAIRQILDWREWLSNNLDYARRPIEDHGLGMTDVRADLPGLILIGRRSDLDQATRHRRHRLSIEHRIDIRTFDGLLQSVRSDPPYGLKD